MPARAGIACGIAEGGLRMDAERFGLETAYGQNLLKSIERYGIDTAGDWDGSGRTMTGRQAWDALMYRVWPDVSFGPMQITVQHADAFGDGTASYENVMAFRAWAETDARGSIRWAMRYLASKYRPGEYDADFKALALYNWPKGYGQAASPAVEVNYRRALAEADHILEGG